MCGEKPVVNPRFQSGRGSPPRVRGEGCCGRLFLELLGITPACAGRRRRSAGPCAVPGDHPRVCGEKSRVDRFRQAQPGSPPRVRGEAQLTFTNVAVDGITPACAGRRYRVYKTSRRAWDHPRVCGEKSCMTGIFSANRITPACAGRSGGGHSRRAAFWDHPRVCGEKSPRQGEPPDRRGSPPRVRGEAWRTGLRCIRPWITPACAGRRASRRALSSSSRDHPRVCGEKKYAAQVEVLKWGSPPRVRGEVGEKSDGSYSGRITPACAGRSYAAAQHRKEAGDHPRVCGEKLRAYPRAVKVKGSPPRVRGEGRLSDSRRCNRRITPACAGRSRPRAPFP